MEEGKSIPLIIMLSAGSIISIACIVYKFTLLQTLLLVLITLIVFYIIGIIIKKLIVSINRDAEQRAALLAQEEQEAKQKELAEKEEVATSKMTTAETDGDFTFE